MDNTTKIKSIIDLGLKYIGRPYEFGSNRSTDKTFDCSDFTRWIFGKFGVKLGMTSSEQSKQGKAVKLSELKVGDLVFFATGSKPKTVTHVAIYMGKDELLHTYKVGVGVTRSSFKAGGYWRTHALFGRRVI